jgi:hypothetical protein
LRRLGGRIMGSDGLRSGRSEEGRSVGWVLVKAKGRWCMGASLTLEMGAELVVLGSEQPA